MGSNEDIPLDNQSMDTFKDNNNNEDFKILSPEQTVELMNQMVSESVEVTHLPNHIIRNPLNHFHWDQQRLYDQLYADEGKLFSDAHIVNTNNPMPSTSDTCFICFDDVSAQEMTSASCGHQFCINCWEQYLTNKIISECVSIGIRCPQNGCDVIVDDQTIARLIKDPEVMAKYQDFLTKSFVVSNRCLRWCPTPGCSKVIKVNFVDLIPFKCECGSVLCFKCGDKWHEPTPCYILKNRTKKYSGLT